MNEIIEQPRNLEIDAAVTNERLDAIVRSVFYIEDTTHGGSRSDYIVRYHGRLLIELD